jgi:hypothetical protein
MGPWRAPEPLQTTNAPRGDVSQPTERPALTVPSWGGGGGACVIASAFVRFIRASTLGCAVGSGSGKPGSVCTTDSGLSFPAFSSRHHFPPQWPKLSMFSLFFNIDTSRARRYWRCAATFPECPALHNPSYQHSTATARRQRHARADDGPAIRAPAARLALPAAAYAARSWAGGTPAPPGWWGGQRPHAKTQSATTPSARTTRSARRRAVITPTT